MSPFKIGDKVRWSSTSKGPGRSKEGVVVYCVPANTAPATYPDRKLLPEIEEYLRGRRLEYTTNYLGTGAPRPEESYLIAVDGKLGKPPYKLYWPRVAWLTKCE